MHFIQDSVLMRVSLSRGRTWFELLQVKLERFFAAAASYTNPLVSWDVAVPLLVKPVCIQLKALLKGDMHSLVISF